MAKAIKQIDRIKQNEEEEKEQALSDILNQLADNREALTNTLEILNELQKTGILDMVRGLLRTRDKVGSIAIEQINQPSMHNMIKNGFNMIEFLGELDPDQVQKIMNGMHSGVDKTSEGMKKDETIGIWGMMKSIRDPHVNRSITTMFNFLEGMGEGLDKKQTH